MKKTAELDRKYTECFENGNGDPGAIVAQLFNHAYGLEHATSALQKEVEELRQEREWRIEPPKVTGTYIVDSGSWDGIISAFWSGSRWYDYKDINDYVLGWLPLPKPIK